MRLCWADEGERPSFLMVLVIFTWIVIVFIEYRFKIVEFSIQIDEIGVNFECPFHQTFDS